MRRQELKHTSTPDSTASLPCSESHSHVAMMSWTDDRDRPKRVMPSVLRVGPKNAKLARDVTAAERLVTIDTSGNFDATSSVVAAGQSPNAWAGNFNVVVEPRYIGAYADYWDILDTSKAFKPIHGSIFRNPEPFSLTEMDRAERLSKDFFEFHLEGDWTFYGGDPHMIYGGRL